MRISKKTRKTNGLVVLLALTGLVLGSAGPALAATTVGSGTGGGYEYANPISTFCDPTFPFSVPPRPDWGTAYSDDTFVLTHASTYDVLSPGTTVFASFVGTTETTITIGDVVQAPQGAAPGYCTVPRATIIPAPVNITNVKITGATLGGVVDCNGTSGHYLRVSTAVTFDFTVTCAITGNVPQATGSVTNYPVSHVIVGNQIACPLTGCPNTSDVSIPPSYTPTSVLQTTFVAS